MKEIKFEARCPIKDYPQALQDEIRALYPTCKNSSSPHLNLERTVDNLLHWRQTRQGHSFWADLYHGRDMSGHTQWLHLFEETESEPQYEIY